CQGTQCLPLHARRDEPARQWMWPQETHPRGLSSSRGCHLFDWQGARVDLDLMTIFSPFPVQLSPVSPRLATTTWFEQFCQKYRKGNLLNTRSRKPAAAKAPRSSRRE